MQGVPGRSPGFLFIARGESVRLHLGVRRDLRRNETATAGWAALCGIAAALVAPWHLEGLRLKRLLAGPGGAGARGREDGRAAVRWANFTLRVLARLPASPWRNTCLYRAVAGCLALRGLGLDATVRIGARRDAEQGRVLAHAWIDSPADGPAPGAGYRVLSGRRGSEP